MRTYLNSFRRVDGLQPHGGIGEEGEVRGRGGTHGSRATVKVNLVVDETPLLEERMHPVTTASNQSLPSYISDQPNA